MTTNINRRNIVKGAAWTVPVIAVATTAPAFAASALICNPTALCKGPGEGDNTKDYLIRANCTSTGGAIVKVEVYDDKNAVWIIATDNGDGTWLAAGFNDSRRNRQVRITDAAGQESTTTIPFPPC